MTKRNDFRTSKMRTAGVILCGGQSTRMGRPKAWLPLRDEVMLQRIVGILREVVEPIVVVAAPGQDVPLLPPGVATVRDAQLGRGPLQGIAAGLAALVGQADAAYVSSCDVPFLQPAFVRRMIDLIGEHTICVPLVGEHHHPLAAVYRLDVLPTVERLLVEDRLRTSLLLEAVPTRVVEAHELRDVDPRLQSLWNLNTPADYDQAVRTLACQTGRNDGNPQP